MKKKPFVFTFAVVVALVLAGSLLEFALDDVPTFGVARIHSMYMFHATAEVDYLMSMNNIVLPVKVKADICDKVLS